MSNGYDFNPFEGARYGDPNIVGQKTATRQRMKDMGIDYDPVHAAEQRVRRRRSRARAVGADARGQPRERDVLHDRSARAGGRGRHRRGRRPDRVEQLRAQDRRTACATLAEQTGGFAVVNQNDFDKALKRIDAETSDYYVARATTRATRTR